ERELPAPVWFFLIVAAVITIGFGLFFADRREHFFVQGFLIAAVTSLVVSGLLLVWFLDHPYENSAGSIKPDQMERVLPIVERAHRPVVPPWDGDGQPLELPA